MLILNPRSVAFGTASWENVRLVSIERRAHREVVEWSDAGPYVVMMDVPEQRVDLTVEMELTRDDLAAPRPGDQATLTLFTSPTASDAGRRKVSATCVVVRVEHEVSTRIGATRRVRLIAVSGTGAADPVTVTDAETAASES
jgi:hypothetical protein